MAAGRAGLCAMNVRKEIITLLTPIILLNSLKTGKKWRQDKAETGQSGEVVLTHLDASGKYRYVVSKVSTFK